MLKACRGCHYLNSALKIFVLDALCAKRKWNNNVTRAQPCLTNVKSYCQNSVQDIQNVQFSMVSIQLMIWNRWVAGADATNEKLVIIKVLKHFQEHVLRAKPCLSLTNTLVRTKPEWNLTTQLFGSCNGRQQAPIKLSKDLDPTIEQTSNYLHVRSYSSGSRCARTARLNPNHLSYMAVFMVGVACASGHGAAIWCFGHGEPSQKWTVFYSSGTEPQWRPVECASTVNMRQNL